MSNNETLKLVGTIVDHGQNERIIKIIEHHHIKFHFLCYGLGTAPSHFRQLLGLDDVSKDILFFVAPVEKADKAIEHINEKFHKQGILFSINLSSVGGRNSLNILKGLVV